MKICATSVATDDYYPSIQKNLPGGNSLNFAVQCAKLGHSASFIGAVGEDSMGRWLCKNASSLGIDASRLYRVDGKTASNVLRIKDDGERYSLPEDWNGGAYQDFRLSADDWKFAFSHDAVMITLYDPNFENFLHQHDNGVYTTVDCLDVPDISRIREILPRVSAVQFSAPPEHEDDFHALSKDFDTIIIHTRDALGSAVYHKGEKYHQPAIQVPGVVDTTGCGDTFHASFTCSYLEGKTIAESLKFAAEQASLRLSHYGGINLNLL